MKHPGSSGDMRLRERLGRWARRSLETHTRHEGLLAGLVDLLDHEGDGEDEPARRLNGGG